MCIALFPLGIILIRGDKMYSYTKKTSHAKKRMILGLSAALLCSIGILNYSLSRKDKLTTDTPVFNEEDIPVLQLPKSEERIHLPFQVEANIVLDYYNGSNETLSMTKFEGVYRPNQGIDYSFNDEAFDILAMTSGTVTDVKEDELFGQSITITKDTLSITYQSLQEVNVKVNDEISQGSVLAKAGTNIYNKDLGNHVHIVCELDGKLTDPKTIFDKSLSSLN